MRWLVLMGPHRWVVNGDTPEEASEYLDGILLTLGLERSEAVFEPIEEAA